MTTMLLLSARPAKVIKDAARATKRVENLNLQPLTNETLSTLLDLAGMKVKKFALEQQCGVKYLHLFCEHLHEVALCPHCKTPTNRRYDHKNRCVRHLDIWTMRTLIHFEQRRFECEVCGWPFTENLEWTESKRRQTIAYELHIYERVQKTPRKHVAREEGLSESTVSDIFKRWARRKSRESYNHKMQVLGVDEISLRKGHKQYALVLSDLERHCVILVLPNRRKETFEQWLDNLNEEERLAIKVVSMDMWNPYRQAVRNKLAHAQIVADRFHVVKQLNHQLDLLRRNLQKNADEPLKVILKGCRWILLKKRNELKSEEEAKLCLILEACPELRITYLLREEFRVICDKINDRAQAERFLQAWIWKAVGTGSRYLIRFVKTLRNWWDEFLNYFNDRVTQGFVEGINRAIRGIINRAFGFRNFDNFRLQVLVECGYT